MASLADSFKTTMFHLFCWVFQRTFISFSFSVLLIWLEIEKKKTRLDVHQYHISCNKCLQHWFYLDTY